MFRKFVAQWYRWIIVLFILILAVVWFNRKRIAEHPLTKKKMEFFKALYDQDIDSAKHLIEEVIDSTLDS